MAYPSAAAAPPALAPRHGRGPAPGFAGFVWAGFEGASHRLRCGRRVDSLAGSGHERWAALDLAIAASLGVRTIREALRWHLVGSGRPDWSSARAQIEGARANRLEVIWDICHWGVPEGIDIMAPDWPQRLAEFAHAAALMLRAEGCAVGGWVPVNEIAFWAFAGGEHDGFAPHLRGAGDALKRQLVRGHLAVVGALRSAGAHEPILACEPLIHVVPRPGVEGDEAAARAHLDASFEAVRWILQAQPDAIDVLGLNHYPHNQWFVGGAMLPPGHPARRAPALLLADAAHRFGLPVALAETGAEHPDGDAWLQHIAGELAQARRAGVSVLGACVYPFLDYPGWDDGRHCPCGPIGSGLGWRSVRPGQAAGLAALAASGEERRAARE